MSYVAVDAVLAMWEAGLIPERLPHRQHVVLVALARKSGLPMMGAVHARVRVDTIVAATGLSRRTVFRALTDLEAAGLVQRRRTGRSSDYWLNIAAPVPD